MNMNTKEKAVVIAGSLLLAAMVMIQFVVRPMADRLDSDRRAVVEGEKDLQKLRSLNAEYLQLKAEMDGVREKIARHKGGAGPLSVLEGIEKDCGFSRNVTMQSDAATAVGPYSETRIRIKLEGVAAEQATGFLMKIQSADAPLGVRSLKLTAVPKTPGTWNAEIEVVSVAPAG